MEMKIVTYNVNGLRPRISQHGSLLKLLSSFEADIICFQETKLSRQDMTADLIMAEGYESFFSCTRTCNKGRIGYSGVATFCRVNSAFSSTEVTLPLSAEEGFTGLLEIQRGVGVKKDEMPAKVEGLEGMTKRDLLKIDSEGRCIITDHGHFVLFNIYGPRAEVDDTERLQYKRMFFEILQKRWESLLSQGKRVFVVGDLNIAPASIDSCRAGPNFMENEFRRWLRSILVEQGGPFFDVFRAKHPERKEAYTCWPQQTGAEKFNYGSRIDHILIAGLCLHQDHDMQGHNFIGCHVKECDIMTQFKRWKLENTPRWNGGLSMKLEGSDHAPVYISLREIPNIPLHNTPSLSARYAPEVYGFQQTIVSLLMRRQVTAQVKDNGLSHSSSDRNIAIASCSQSVKRPFQDCGVSGLDSDEKLPTSNPESESVSLSVTNEDLENTVVMTSNKTTKSVSPPCMAAKKKARHNYCSQRTLRSFFQKKPKHSDDCGSTDISLRQVDVSEKMADTHLTKEMNSPTETLVGDENSNCNTLEVGITLSTQCQGVENVSGSSDKEKNDVLLEWRRIQQLMQNSIPLCKGHGEPCVARAVKKPGPNLGRMFYVCARAEGPPSNPEARCEYFKWASSKSGKK